MAYDTWEAARLISWSNRQAGLGPLTEAELTRWIDNGVGLLEWEDVWEEDGVTEKRIDFPSLISLRLICLLHFYQASLDEITETARHLKKYLGVQWPYASESLWSSWFEVITEVSYPIHHALLWLAISNALNPSGLKFGPNGIANAWLPLNGVVIDPSVVSGSPCVVGTRTPTWVFTGMLKGGDKIEELADGYRLSVEQVRKALDWESQLDAVGV